MEECGCVIVYRLTELEQIQRDKFCREFLGRTVKTHRGKYTHTITGFLDAVPHIMVTRGVLIINKKDRQRVASFFKKWKLKDIFIRDVFLTKEDRQRLKK